MQSNGSGKRCPQVKVAPKPEPVANHASTWNKNSNRLLGTRTSHHVTTDLQNLSLHTDYEGPADIISGDGSGLQITQVGTTQISSPLQPVSLKIILLDNGGRMPHLQFL